MTARSAVLLAAFLLLTGCRSQRRHAGGVAPVYTPPPRSQKAAPALAGIRSQSPIPVRVGARLVSLDLEGASLHDAVRILQSSTGANIVVSPLVDELRTSDELLVSVRLSDVTVSNALDVITRLLRLRWYTETGVIFITVPGDAPREPDRRIYSIHDLLNPVTNSN